MEEIHCIVTGRVQMVMFRDFTRRNARRLGIAGHVKNVPDGTVEVVAQGEREALERLLEALRHGPFFARVDGVRVQWKTPLQTYQSFRILY